MGHERLRVTSPRDVAHPDPAGAVTPRRATPTGPSTVLGPLLTELARSPELMFSGPTRIQRASISHSPGRAPGRPTSAAASARGDLIIRRRIDQTYAQFVQTQPPANTAIENTTGYFAVVRNELSAVKTRLPDEGKYLIAAAEGMLRAALDEARRLGRNATPAQLQQYHADFIEPLVEEVNRVDDELAAAANSAAAAAALRAQQEADARDAWAYEDSDYGTPVPPGAEPDLRTLLANAGGQFYKSKIGTIVGGRSAKSGKKIDGVAPGARLDVQSPPKKNLFNIQYQVDGWSYAGALFAHDDPSARVETELIESLIRGQVATSPAYRARR